MNPFRFNRLTCIVAQRTSRRALIAAPGFLGITIPGLAGAKEKHKRKSKKKRIRRNGFGCVNVGGFCKNSDQCCSGFCRGKKGKKKCKAHGQSTCQAGQTVEDCGGVEVECTTTTGADGACTTTTGNAAYCFSRGDCFPCAKDADCEVVCGPGAACIVCAGCASRELVTACVGLSADSCAFF
jgi:hypothetical protein